MEAEQAAATPWKAFLGLELKPFFALLPLIKEVLPEKFFVVEEGVACRLLNFSRIRYLSTDEADIQRWIDEKTAGILVRVDEGNFVCRGGCQSRKEMRFWTEVYKYEGPKTGPLGKKRIVAGTYFCIAEMTASELAMKMSDS